jgi:hypothetical protein
MNEKLLYRISECTAYVDDVLACATLNPALKRGHPVVALALMQLPFAGFPVAVKPTKEQVHDRHRLPKR